MMLVFVLAVLFVTATAAPSGTPDTDHDTAKGQIFSKISMHAVLSAIFNKVLTSRVTLVL